jgi:general secretion pathway protein D
MRAGAAGVCVLALLASAPGRGRAEGPAAEARAAEAAAAEERFQLDFQDADLTDVIKTIADMTKRNILYDDRVRGRVTLISPDRVTLGEAWRVFESILQSKGFTTVEGPANVVKILPIREAKESPIETSTPERFLPNRDLFITRLIPLKYVKADAISNTLRPLVSANASLVAYGPTNTMIFTDTAANIRRLLTIIEQVDVATYQEQIKVIPIHYADAATLAGQLGEIFSAEVSGAAGRAPARRPPVRATGAQPAEAVIETFAEQVGQPRFITDARTNSIIVIAPQPTIRAVESLVALLDYRREGSGRIHVYRLQNADAQEMAQTLQSLATGGRPAAAGAAGVAPAAAAVQAAVAALEEGVRVTADAPTNSLIIQASSEGFAAVRDVVEALDVRRPQVLVEALLLEIAVDDQTALGGGILYQSLLDDNEGDRIVIGSNTGISPLAGGPFFGALANEVTNPGAFSTAILGRTITVRNEEGELIELPVIQGILTARGSDSDTNIILAPTILTADNEESQITVGQNIPIITSRVQSAEGVTGAQNLATSNTVERQDVGVTLRVTPQISEGDTVRLDVFEEISQVLSEDPDLGPTTSKRTVENTVYVKDMETVLIGGIIQDRQTTSLTKVPFLGDIPILGWAFKSTTDRTEKVNLLIVLTPHIIRDPQDLRRVTLEHRERFRSEAGDALEYGKAQREARERALAAGMELPLDPNPVRRHLEVQERRYPLEELPELRKRHQEMERQRLEEMESRAAVEGGQYAVQVAFFRTAEEAVSLLKSLMARGYDGTVLSSTTPEGVVHYVQLGPYLSEDRAQHVAREVRAQTGMSPQVVVEP